PTRRAIRKRDWRCYLRTSQSSSRTPALAQADRCIARRVRSPSEAKMHAYKDLREFLSVLQQQRQPLRIPDQVRLEPDLAAAACALTQIGEGSPAIYFDRIAGCSDAKVALNVHGSWSNHALALGMEKDASMRDQFFEFVRRFQKYPGAVEHV